MPQNNAKASEPSKREKADDVHWQVRAMPSERNPVRVMPRKGESRRDGFVGAGVSSSEEDLAPVASLEPSVHDARDVVPPGDVVDQVGIGRVASHGAGVHGPLGA